ncbi:MAG: helix-hairpin-helix domain-containing protein [Chloroflexota bacterium]|nr:helix-hairpin-helix domain-containing protein [Chloroflexota bacterium]
MDQGAARYRGYVVVFSVFSLIVGGVIGYFIPRSQTSVPIIVSTPHPTVTPLPTPTPAPIRVHVSGAVRQPAVYELSSGSIVQDAVDAAGGPAADADLDHINLALELEDQQQVYVPCQGETNPPPSVSGGASGGGGSVVPLVNINTATTAELETLPRIGPVTAQHIVDYREANGSFQSIEEIQDVPGIGPATFEGLEDLITVRP